MSSTSELSERAPTSRLQRSRDARRARVIDVVLTLAEAEGYDAVQIRAVSERSGVGSDTIYRYFGSRDGLMSAAAGEWLEREFLLPSSTWHEGDTVAEQIMSHLRHVWNVWERHPRMLETFVRTATVEGEVAGGLSDRSIRVLAPALTDLLTPLDAELRGDFLLVIQSVTHSAMINAVSGKIAVDDIYPLIERTVRLLAHHPAMEHHRPTAWTYPERGAPTSRRRRVWKGG